MAESEHISGDLIVTGAVTFGEIGGSEVRDQLGQLLRTSKAGVTVDWTPTMQFRYARRNVRSIDHATGRTVHVLQQYWTGHQWRDQQGPIGKWRDIPTVDE